MNAALNRDHQLVEFIWDSREAEGTVRMYSYDFRKDAKPYTMTSETRENARQWWAARLVGGDDRIQETTEPLGFEGFPLNLSL